MFTLKKEIYDKLFLLLIWLSFFLSININPAEFFINNLIKKLSISLPLFLVITLVILKFKEIIFSRFLNIHTFFFYCIFFLYIFFNLLFIENDLVNIFWPLYMFLSFLTLHIFTNSDEKTLILKFTVLIIFSGFIFYFFAALFEMIKSSNLHFYGVLGSSLNYAGFDSPPRSSGLSRLALILFTFLSYYYLINLSKRNNLILIGITFFGICSLIFQSRTNSFIFIFMNFFFLIFYFKKILHCKRLIIFALILPVIINSSYNYLYLTKIGWFEMGGVDHSLYGHENQFTEMQKKQLQINTFIYSFTDSLIRDQTSIRKSFEVDKNESNQESWNRYSSSRFNNWNLAYNIIKKNYIRGYGAQADRLLIKQSIHNAIFYSTLSGGLFAGIALLYIYLYSLIMLLKFYFNYTYRESANFLTHFAGSILIILNLRSILETSFAVFGIDFLVYIIAFLFFKNELDKHDKIKI